MNAQRISAALTRQNIQHVVNGNTVHARGIIAEDMLKVWGSRGVVITSETKFVGIRKHPGKYVTFYTLTVGE